MNSIYKLLEEQNYLTMENLVRASMLPRTMVQDQLEILLKEGKIKVRGHEYFIPKDFEFDVGDLVKLIGQNVIMTIIQVNKDNYLCAWQDVHKAFWKECFTHYVLRKVGKERIVEALKRVGVEYAGKASDPRRWSVTDLATDLEELL